MLVNGAVESGDNVHKKRCPREMIIVVSACQSEATLEEK
jgi:hypothetical protein